LTACCSVGQNAAWARSGNGRRDIKPANVFIDRNQQFKLGDFGLARILSTDTQLAKTNVGTPYYMAPEQVNELPYNEKCDIWSMGCLLYEMAALVRFPAPHTHDKHTQSAGCLDPPTSAPHCVSSETLSRTLFATVCTCASYAAVCCAVEERGASKAVTKGSTRATWQQAPPFEAANQLALAVKIKAGRVARLPEGYSDELNNAIRSMLQLESCKRPR